MTRLMMLIKEEWWINLLKAIITAEKTRMANIYICVCVRVRACARACVRVCVCVFQEQFHKNMKRAHS
jgi:hypothetical protein